MSKDNLFNVALRWSRRTAQDKSNKAMPAEVYQVFERKEAEQSLEQKELYDEIRLRERRRAALCESLFIALSATGPGVFSLEAYKHKEKEVLSEQDFKRLNAIVGSVIGFLLDKNFISFMEDEKGKRLDGCYIRGVHYPEWALYFGKQINEEVKHV